MNVDDMSAEELAVLINQATAALRALREQEAQEAADRRAQLGQAVAVLDALIGAEDTAPGTDSLRAVLKFDGPTMVTHAAVALPLAFQAQLILAETTRTIAQVLATD